MQVSVELEHQSRNSQSDDFVTNIARLDKISRYHTLYIVETKRLAQFLRNNASKPYSEPSVPFSYLYELRKGEHPVQIPSSPTYTPTGSDSNRLLFLTGYPSARLLVQIGSRFGIDPAFFDAHLSFVRHGFTSCDEHPSFHCLPSRSKTVFRTSFTSIGYAPEDPRFSNISEKRTYFNTQMERYLSDLKTGTHWKSSQSIVRAIEVHDLRRFSLEQNITVSIQHSTTHQGRWLIIVWSDAGNGLINSPRGPWFDKNYAYTSTHFRPVALHRKVSIGMSSDHHVDVPTRVNPEVLHQSATLLAQNYGRSLDTKRLASHPMYALEELFVFLAISEGQYLDLVKTVLEDNVPSDRGLNSKTNLRALETLDFAYKRLEHRRSELIARIDFIKTQIESFPENSNPISEITVILRDHEYLHGEILRLMARCDHEWTVLTSEAAVADAKWSRDQSRVQYKFTVLATVYVPISFSCSLFGMTFFELGSIRQGFTIWAFVTAPLFVLSVGLLFWDGEYMSELWKRLISMRRQYGNHRVGRLN